jgi:dipeptidyl aminopeptidase/acylaminoacyl peptidase
MSNYEDFLPAQRLGNSLSISADGTMVAYISDTSGQFNLWTQPVDGGPARQLTFFTDCAVREVAWAADRTALAFTADAQGDEQYQVYLVPADSGEPRLVSNGTGQHFLAEKAPFGMQRFLLYSGPDDDSPGPALIAYDLPSATEDRWPGPAHAYGFAIGLSPDGQHVLGGMLASNTKCQCYAGSAAAPGAPLEAVTAELPGDYYYPGPWAGDSRSFFVLTTDADHDHVSLARLCLHDRSLTIVDSPPWNVEDVVASADGRTQVWSVNQDGYSALRACRDGTELTMPPVPGGVITAMSICGDGTLMALRLDTPDRPASVVMIRPGTDEPARFLTDTRPPAFASRPASVPELIRYPAKDESLIPAWLHRPPGPGPHPVLLSVHGGPEHQARPEYNPLHQALIASGIAVLAPNIHGSSGYGHEWQNRIYRNWGGIDLDDLAAAHAWLSAQPWADEHKIGVFGTSYGGFAALSCITRLPQLWAAGVSVCGPSNLESLARSMPPDWAAMVAAMFGDPDDRADAEDMSRRSPLTYARQIKAPLLVVQGANDPRVPKAESDQIIDAACANGADPRYVVFEDEGHGFTSRDNDIKANQTIVEFLAEQLLP